MIIRTFIFFIILLFFVVCNPVPGMKLSEFTVEVVNSCADGTLEHTVRIWAPRDQNLDTLVLVDSILLAANASQKLSFLSLEQTYFQLVGSGDCRSTWNLVNTGQSGKQELSYTHEVSYLTIDITSNVGDERDSLEINIYRINDTVLNLRLSGDESNHAIKNISYADLPLDSIDLTKDGYYQVEILNYVNGVPRLLQPTQTIHATDSSLILEF